MKAKSIAILILGAAWVLVALPASADGYSDDFSCPGNPPGTMCTFADCFQAVYETILIDMLPPGVQPMIALFHPDTADINGVSYVDTSVNPDDVVLTGNGMNDSYGELALVEYFLQNNAFTVNGITGAQVRDNYNQIRAQMAIDIGPVYWFLLPIMLNGLHQIFIGEMLIGDGDAVFSME